jgi:hypothetical protein
MDGTLIVSRKNQELIAKMKAQIRISSCNTLFPERYELTPSTNEIKRVKFDPESLFCIVTVLVKQEANNWSPVARAYLDITDSVPVTVYTFGYGAYGAVNVADFRLVPSSTIPPLEKQKKIREDWKKLSGMIADDINTAKVKHDRMRPATGDLSGKYIPAFEGLPACTWMLYKPQKPLPDRILRDLFVFETLAMHMNPRDFVEIVETQFESKKEHVTPEFLNCIQLVMSMLRLTANMFKYMSDKGYPEGTFFTDIELFKNLRALLTAGDCEDLAFEICMLYRSIKMMEDATPVVRAIKKILNLFVVVMVGGVASLPSLTAEASQSNGRRVFHIYALAIPRHAISDQPPYPWAQKLKCEVLEGTNFHAVDFTSRLRPEDTPLPPAVRDFYQSHVAMLELYKSSEPGAEIGTEPAGSQFYSCFYREVVFAWSDEIAPNQLEFMFVTPRTDVYGVSFEKVVNCEFELVPTHTFTRLDKYREFISLREVLPQYQTSSLKVEEVSSQEMHLTKQVPLALALRSTTPSTFTHQSKYAFSADLHIDYLCLHLRTISVEASTAGDLVRF